jgi:hypothetical protein
MDWFWYSMWKHMRFCHSTFVCFKTRQTLQFKLMVICNVAGLQAELTAAHKESECMRRRLRQLEEDLGSFKQKNTELQDELQRKAGAVHHTHFWTRICPVLYKSVLKLSQILVTLGHHFVWQPSIPIYCQLMYRVNIAYSANHTHTHAHSRILATVTNSSYQTK